MIVLPNSFEKYLYNLRIYNSFSILKHNLLPRHLKNLKNIYLSEALLFKNHTEPTDLQLLSYNLLCCAKSRKNLDFQIKIKQKVMINQRLYIALLLLLSKSTAFLKLEYKNGITIKGKGEIKNAQKVIYHLGGYSFFNLKTMNYLIYIPCPKTDLYPTQTISQWELIFDKFSPFNLFYN